MANAVVSPRLMNSQIPRLRMDGVVKACYTGFNGEKGLIVVFETGGDYDQCLKRIDHLVKNKDIIFRGNRNSLRFEISRIPSVKENWPFGVQAVRWIDDCCGTSYSQKIVFPGKNPESDPLVFDRVEIANDSDEEPIEADPYAGMADPYAEHNASDDDDEMDVDPALPPSGDNSSTWIEDPGAS